MEAVMVLGLLMRLIDVDPYMWSRAAIAGAVTGVGRWLKKGKEEVRELELYLYGGNDL